MMSEIFADAQYYVALLHVKDQGHAAAVAIDPLLQGTTVVTTEEVLTEVLAFFAERGQQMRQVAVGFIDSIFADPETIVLPQSHQSFGVGLALFRARPDKGYSLTDCISMEVMRERGITEILTHDNHFLQEGFRILL